MIGSVQVYSKTDCPYCRKTKQLLNTMDIPFTEEVLLKDFTREYILEKFPLAKTYPIIVVDGFHIGGYTQLVEKINESANDTKKLLNE